MKKLILTLGIALGFIGLHASPVSLEEACALGRGFVGHNFAPTRQSMDLQLVYTTPSFYVFNVSDKGFVILSADDSYNPIIGYSEEGAFNPEDMAPALQDYLAGIDEYRTNRGSAVASKTVADNWEMLRNHGTMVSRFGGREASFLLTTQWNQNYPYNYFCPVDPDGPGGHVYAGCVATAAAQLMKYWDHPQQGTGSHTYTPEDNPQYGPLTANFGATTYDWANMPDAITADSPVEQIEAVGTLIFHCGVAVDMNYRTSGSGAATTKLCTVMPQYFSYTNQMVNIKREDYSREEYLQKLYDAIDMNWPMVHRGGGHAYVLDGYDDFGLVHFNWGWSGNSDGFFDIDGHNYTDGQSVIYNYVPSDVYSATANQPTSLTVTPAADNELSATVSWVNPTVTLTNQSLPSIDMMVVTRNSEVVFVDENVTPGQAMTFVDNSVPCFNAYTYKVYAVVGGQNGKSAVMESVNIGPACQWKFIVSSNDVFGWNGGYIGVYNLAGQRAYKVTVTNASPNIVEVQMPVGPVQLVWVAPEDDQSNYNITINVKNSDNVSVFSYSGGITGMEAGTFYEENNGCGNELPSTSPTDLYVSNNIDNITLNWTGVREDGYGYNVFRDGKLLALSYTTEYVDEAPSIGGHCYQVCYLGLGGMSEFTNEACGNAGEGCDSGSDLWYELQANLKPLITWEAPEVSEGLSGYYVYRKIDGGEYIRVKILGANKKEYKESSSLTPETWYSYKVVPYYQEIDCYAAPIKAKYGNQYCVRCYYTTDDVNENTYRRVSVYPNPTNGMLKIEADMIGSVSVYNLVGQKVFEKNVSADELVIDMNSFGKGVFMVRIDSASGLTTKKITVIE